MKRVVLGAVLMAGSMVSLAACEDVDPADSNGSGQDMGADFGVDGGQDLGRDVGGDAGVNGAPSADAGAERHVLSHHPVVLRGSGSDPDGDALSFSWAQTAGPGVVLEAPMSATASFRPRYVGAYDFELAVADGQGGTAVASTTVFVHDIDGGENHTLALLPSGVLRAWGSNQSGALGDGTTDSSSVPVRVCSPGAADCEASPLADVVAISTSRNASFALDADGRVWSWGSNFDGELGNGTLEARNTPGPVCESAANADCAAAPLSDVVQISAGYRFAAALKSDGSVWTWGFNGNGELGNDQTVSSPFPVQVCAPGADGPCTSFLEDVAFIAAGGGGHTMALDDQGRLWAWGHNKNGQVGNGDSNVDRVGVPIQVCGSGAVAPCDQFLDGVVDADAWSGHTLALDDAGALWGWGSNDDGELGLATTEICISGGTCAETPRRVCQTLDDPCTTPLEGVVDFTAGRRFSMALIDDGTLRAWGDNNFGQLAQGTVDAMVGIVELCAPGQVAPCQVSLSDITGIAAGSFHAFALDADGGLLAWGNNFAGQLGDGGTENQTIPVRVTGY